MIDPARVGRRMLFAALLAGTVARQAYAQDWSRFDEAANVVARVDTGLYLDSARLERVRSGLERSREAFPELRRIQAGGAGIALYLPMFLLPDSARRLIASHVAEHREQRRAGGRWMEIPSTGSRTLDSLNLRFGAARVLASVDSATGATPTQTIAVEYTRPMNVARLESIYEAAGVATWAPLRNVTTWFYPWVSWTPRPDSDLFHFRLDSDCRDPCHRHERYLVRVPLGPGPAVMVEREVRIDPDS